MCPKTRTLVSVVLAMAVGAVGSAQASRLPESYECSRRDVRKLVTSSIRAYNRGDVARLDEIYAEEPDFLGYYAAPERTHRKGEDRSTLMPYFERRHALDDRLTLKVFWVQAEREPDDSFDFYFELERNSRQSRARGSYAGKGNARHAIAVSLESPTRPFRCRLRLWNMANSQK